MVNCELGALSEMLLTSDVLALKRLFVRMNVAVLTTALVAWKALLAELAEEVTDF